MFALALALSLLIGVSLGLLGGGGSILTTPILIYALGVELTRSRLAAAAGTALALVVAVAFPIGANALVSPLLTPEGVAWALLVPALVAWLRRAPVAAGLLIGAAAWLMRKLPWNWWMPPKAARRTPRDRSRRGSRSKGRYCM